MKAISNIMGRIGVGIMNNMHETIVQMRTENFSYAAIAEALQIPKNTVKSVCRRENIQPGDGKTKILADLQKLILCKYCGKPVLNEWNRKSKIFCSDSCRINWWNEERRRRKLRS